MNAPTGRFAELPLEQLIEHALYQLLKLRYSRNALKRYRNLLRHLTSPWSPRSASRGTSDLRSFLRYLLQRQIVHRDLALVLPTIRVPRDGTIPSVWEPELVRKLLKVVDRTSPRGRRNYAILLLASRLGLRSGDIRTLKLDDLQWDTATIEIRQSKTGC